MEHRLAGAGNSPALICPVSSSEACATCALKKCVLALNLCFFMSAVTLGHLLKQLLGAVYLKKTKNKKERG